MATRKILIILILILAAGLRLFRLGTNPPGLSWDEAAIGWNAKTIWEMRLDEYGTHLPWSFKSFGDYKAPLYIYLTAPVVGLLGASEVSIRLLSVVAGVVSIYLIYLIALEIGNWQMGITASMFLAVTPWHLLMSRPALEPNLALSFILLTIYFFIKARKIPVYFIFSGLSAGLSLYSYQSPKIFLPILGIGLILIYCREIFTKRNLIWLAAAAVGLILLIKPIINDWSKGGSARFEGTTIFYRQNTKPLPVLISNYFVHFSPGFLFSGGNIPRIQLKQTGLLLLLGAPFLLLGLRELWYQRRQKWAKLLLWWLLVGPVPAMIGFEAPHPIRAFNWLPALVLITALGLGKFKYKSIAVCLLIINFIFATRDYFLAYPIYSAQDWQYGYKQVAAIAREYEDRVDKIIISSYYGQPYIFTYWYQSRKPQAVFWGGMSKYLFREIKWGSDHLLPNSLIIGSPEDIPGDSSGIIKEINFPDGQVAFRVVKT